MKCANCGHDILLHSGPDNECQVRRMESGHPDFASLPLCGCTFRHTDDCKTWDCRPCNCTGKRQAMNEERKGING